jgi:hypothetical protein
MSTPFTLNHDNFQTLEKLEELRLAFSERYYACNGKFRKYVWQDNTYRWVDGDGTASDTLQNTMPTIADLPVGHNLQAVAFYRGIQDFINDGGAVADDWPRLIKFARPDAETAPFFETIDAFFQTVGGDLYTSAEDFGLRRSVETNPDGSPIMVRGLAEPGDILGPWLIDDLIACLSAITATRVFYKPTDDGTRWGLHNCGIYITCPAWYSRRSICRWFLDYYRMVNTSTCSETLTNEAYQQHLQNGTLPDGDWQEVSTGHFGEIGGVTAWILDDPPDTHRVNFDSATETYGWPEPWETLVREDIFRPPWDVVIPPGDWKRQAIGHYAWETVEQNGSGYSSVDVRDTADGGTQIFQWCSYKTNPTSPNAPDLSGITFYKEVFTYEYPADPVSDGPAAKAGEYPLGDTITLNPERTQSKTDPYFVANWDFTNAGIPSA